MKNILVTQYYKTNHIDRQYEIDHCLIENTKSGFLDRIIVFSDYDLPIYNEKILKFKINFENRITYKEFLLGTRIDGNNYILSNSDIIFDSTLDLLQNYNMDNKVLCLTRWEDNKIFDRIDSQDTWIVRDINVTDRLLEKSDFPIGKPGCDNRIAAVFKEEGFDVINPSLDIKTHHIHKSQYRTYTQEDRISGPYYLLPPSKLI